jgi:hypothetical protein
VSGLPSSATQPTSTSLLHAQRHVQASAAPEAASLCAGHVQQLGGASPLPDLMEVRVSKTQGLPSRDGV